MNKNGKMSRLNFRDRSDVNDVSLCTVRSKVLTDVLRAGLEAVLPLTMSRPH